MRWIPSALQRDSRTELMHQTMCDNGPRRLQAFHRNAGSCVEPVRGPEEFSRLPEHVGGVMQMPSECGFDVTFSRVDSDDGQEAAKNELERRKRELANAQNDVNTTKEDFFICFCSLLQEEANVEKLQAMTRGDVAKYIAGQELYFKQHSFKQQLKALERELANAQNDVNTTKEDFFICSYSVLQQEANVEKLQAMTRGDVAKYIAGQELYFKQQLKALEGHPDVKKTPKKSIVLLGETGTGKSSLINRLFGTNEKTGPLRTTMDIAPVVETDAIQVWDVFGENDEESYHNMETLTIAKSLHVVCIVVKALKVDKVHLCNTSEVLSEEEVAVVMDHDKNKLHEVTEESSRVFLTSAKTGMGLDKLKEILEGGPASGAGQGYGKAESIPGRSTPTQKRSSLY